MSADPRDLAERRRIADTFAYMGRTEDAIAEYQALAGRYAADGRLMEAIALGKLILQLDPAHLETQRALAQFAIRRAGREQWQARLPPSMAPLIPETRLDTATNEVELTVEGAPQSEDLPELPREVMVQLLQRVTLRSVEKGTTLVREGDPGASMFSLVEGEARVLRGQREVDRIGKGSLFGEIALLSDVPRVATVVAATDCILLEVSRDLLRELAPLPQVAQQYAKERLVANLLRSNDLFAAFTRGELARLVERFEPRTAQRGDALVKQGENGKGLFVLLRGKCVAYDEPTGQEYPELGEGAVFGEISLLELSPATATVRAETRCVLLFLDRDGFAEEVLRNAQAAKKLEKLARERLDRTAELPPALI